MTETLIQVKYEALKDVAVDFERQAVTVRRLQQVVTAQVAVLRGGGWNADSASAFFTDMENNVLPALGRLGKALELGEQTTQQIITLFQQSEAEACACLNGIGENAVGSSGEPIIPNWTTMPVPDFVMGMQTISVSLDETYWNNGIQYSDYLETGDPHYDKAKEEVKQDKNESNEHYEWRVQKEAHHKKWLDEYYNNGIFEGLPFFDKSFEIGKWISEWFSWREEEQKWLADNPEPE